MCNGRREIEEEKIDQDNIIVCELCKSEAYVYCEADNAFLCRKCDKLVHTANFLAQRHIRRILCGICKRLTKRYLIGVSYEVILLKVVRWNNLDEENCSRKVKEPFLFL
ncbi:hypothetical protein R3W88_032337 [Solanum pinnatisectum]|uniref:B box-type domain-containing protein n=1 Tax=Solanum pinnatisectum TaxID=50273 RepID=A0AAV9LNV6_9SOLN|nr:hypothetical protein R3W88_032337 [Solanum pinnatisectum]